MPLKALGFQEFQLRVFVRSGVSFGCSLAACECPADPALVSRYFAIIFVIGVGYRRLRTKLRLEHFDLQR